MSVRDHGLDCIRKASNEITPGDKSNYYIYFRGESSTSGLKTAGLITVVTLNSSTWTALPTTPLTNRNALAIQNTSNIDIKINYNNAQAGYVGMTIAAEAERFYDITEDIIIYAKSASGTPSINVEELS